MLGRTLVEGIDEQESAATTHVKGIEQCLGSSGEHRRRSMAQEAARIATPVGARGKEYGHFVVEMNGGDGKVMEMERLGGAAGADDLMIAACEKRVEKRLASIAVDRLGQKRW